MIFDTDVVIWVFRGHEEAAKLVDGIHDRQVSIVTYMEFMQGARNRQELKTIKNFLNDHLTENIGHRASVYM